MTKTIAFCTDAKIFQQNRILDEKIVADYPGALWVTKLAGFAKVRGIEVVTGDIAISNICAKNWKPSDIMVIQEESSSHGFELIRLGAFPFVLYCAESPLYARNFYTPLPRISALFQNRILFRGSFERASSDGMNHVLHFPSFSLESEEGTVSWSQRKFLVMVAANKYWKIKRAIHRQLLAWIRDTVMGRKSYITPETIDQQLHDRRLALIEYFGREGSLDLFGSNWGDISNLPKRWKGRLQEIIDDLKPEVCPNKQKVIANYKFAICFENMSYPGYVTEKIIDCFRAGVIPVYLGAPDISDFVPKEAFIDLRGFGDLDGLHGHLSSITEDIASEMIDAGRSFLMSKSGMNYSYEIFAKNVINMIREYQ